MRPLRALLWLLPSSFRSGVRDEDWLAILEARLRDAPARSALLVVAARPLDVVGLCARVHLDVLRQDLRYVPDRCAARPASRSPSSPWPRSGRRHGRRPSRSPSTC
jgi:hypothetical protein